MSEYPYIKLPFYYSLCRHAYYEDEIPDENAVEMKAHILFDSNSCERDLPCGQHRWIDMLWKLENRNDGKVHIDMHDYPLNYNFKRDELLVEPKPSRFPSLLEIAARNVTNLIKVNKIPEN